MKAPPCNPFVGIVRNDAEDVDQCLGSSVLRGTHVSQEFLKCLFQIRTLRLQARSEMPRIDTPKRLSVRGFLVAEWGHGTTGNSHFVRRRQVIVVVRPQRAFRLHRNRAITMSVWPAELPFRYYVVQQ